MKTLNNKEEKVVQEYHKLFDAKRELHKLMFIPRRDLTLTGRSPSF